MYFKKRVGKIGENLACKYLKENNYKILERNFNCRQGEIDIIAKDKETKELVFIEVRTRSSFKYKNSYNAVDTRRKEHIYNAAKFYIYKNRLQHSAIRFDVIEVFVSVESYRINHIKIAF